MTGTWSAEPAHALSAYTFLLASQEMELKKMFLKKVFFQGRFKRMMDGTAGAWEKKEC